MSKERLTAELIMQAWLVKETSGMMAASRPFTNVSGTNAKLLRGATLKANTTQKKTQDETKRAVRSSYPDIVGASFVK